MRCVYSWILMAVVLTTSCNESQRDDDALTGKLSTSLVDNPIGIDKHDKKELQQLGHLMFQDTLHNLGKIQEGEIVNAEFVFKNTGKKAVLINNATASCGCTKPSYPEEPIDVNKEGVINVSFNSEGKVGYNKKAISINTNAYPAIYNLYIETEVAK